MSEKWRKALFEIAKYAIGAILGAAGFSVTGCACFPSFNF